VLGAELCPAGSIAERVESGRRTNQKCEDTAEEKKAFKKLKSGNSESKKEMA
jgi:hypothetical protein